MAADELSAALPPLVRASVEGALLALLVGVLCRLRPAPSAALRAGLWWLVSLKLLVGLLPLPAIAVPLVPAGVGAALEGRAVAEPPAPVAARSLPDAELSVGQADGQPTPVFVAVPSPGAPQTPAGAPAGGSASAAGFAWRPVLAALWLGGVLLQAAGLAWHLARWRGLWRRAAPAPEPLQALAASIASRIGLARCPDVRVSSETSVPQVGGAWRPVVIVPAGATSALSGAELAMVLGHELAHVRRRDLLFGWVPALAERVFFFHPAAWLASREYALAREAACDQMVLDAFDAPPAEYGRLLLRLGVGAGDTRLVAAGASPTVRLLKRRLSMLASAPSPSRLRSLLVFALVAAAACAPVDVARKAPPARSAPPAPAPPPAPAEAADETADATPDADDAAPPDDGADRADDSKGPPAPAARRRHRDEGERPGRARDEGERRGRAREEGERWGRPRDAWVLIDPRAGDSVFMSGSPRDLEAARRAGGSKNAPQLYVRRGDKAYVIADPATVAAARKLFEPQLELAHQQVELGKKQGKLGGEQGALGARQGELGARQAMLGSKLAAREMTRAAEEMSRRGWRDGAREDAAGRARRAGDDARAEREGRERAEREGRERAEIERQIHELARQQRELGREQASFGEKQAALGREQARLGERQREAGERAERELRALVDKAIAAGAATPAR
jgi:bla regulator protein blaR1